MSIIVKTMSGNTEPTSNSIKFAPMPMSALLANLMPLQAREDSPDCSFTSEDDSDNSMGVTVANKPHEASKPESKYDSKIVKEFVTPNVKSQIRNDLKSFASEKKLYYNDHNKENNESWISNQTYPNKDSHIPKAQKNVVNSVYNDAEVKQSNVILPVSQPVTNKPTITNSVKSQTSASLKTPEMPKRIISSAQKPKTPTPVIKSGIRKYTPGSARKSQHKKTPQKTELQRRDKIRCELFTPQQNEKSSSSLNPPTRQEVARTPAPETPMSRKPLPMPCAATPSYPQGLPGNHPKILFKTISIKDKKYMFMRKLGTGGSSEVYKVSEVGSSCEYAVKCVCLATDHELAQGYINEVRLLRELQNSDRVIRLFDYEYDRSKQVLRMVLEVGETDLSSFLKARGAALPPALVVHYWGEMLHAVHYIHEHGVIHADLKPANFLLVSGRLKLIDFGIASAISVEATSVVRAQAAGTYSYISPEALMGGAGGGAVAPGEHNAPIKISFRSDVWSLGCILYSMVYGRTPFGHIPNLAKIAAILNPNHRIEYPPVPAAHTTPPDQLPGSVMGALMWCLRYNARERPAVRELLAVPYLSAAAAPAPLLARLRALLPPDDYRSLELRP